MREIKFRAWVGTHKLMFQVREMIIPDGLNEAGMQEIAATDNYSIVRPLHYIQPILMQYTGLKDKNGKEIYEGDIINFNIQDYRGLDHFYKSEVYYWGSCFSCDTGESCLINLDTIIAEDDEIEIIGNIYENPELLK